MVAVETGTLLIAEPFLKDPNFMRSVILMCRHNEEEGSFGFVLNKIYELGLDELIPGLAGFDWTVYEGGPVQMDTLHYIHQYPHLLKDSQLIGKGIYWGGDFELVKELIKNEEIKPSKIKFFLGYSGWASKQLNHELEENTWITASSSRKIVFDTQTDEIWKESLHLLGGRYQMMANFPIDPQLN